MALPHPKQQKQKSTPEPEKVEVKSSQIFENGLFALLGAICAIVVGLAIYGDLSLRPSERKPASTESIIIETQPTEFYQQLPNGY